MSTEAVLTKTIQNTIREIGRMNLKELCQYRNALIALEPEHSKYRQFLLKTFAQIEAMPRGKTKELRSVLEILERAKAHTYGITLEEQGEK